jgi:hypothetical protein
MRLSSARASFSVLLMRMMVYKGHDTRHTQYHLTEITESGKCLTFYQVNNWIVKCKRRQERGSKREMHGTILVGLQVDHGVRLLRLQHVALQDFAPLTFL